MMRAARHTANRCLCLALFVASFVVAHYEGDGERSLLIRREDNDFKPCGTDESMLADYAQRNRRSLRALQGSEAFEGATIPVFFHVGYIKEDGVGRAHWFDDRDAATKALLRTLDNANEVLSGSGSVRGPHLDTRIRLCWGGVKFYEGYEYTCPHSTARGDWLRSTSDNDRTQGVNVFICNLGLSGGVVYTMPDRQRESHVDHAFFLHYKTLNGWMCDVNEHHCSGDSMAHEFGHYLGLWHPWNGGCTSYSNDFVTDTPMVKRFYSGDCKVRAKDKAILGMKYIGNKGKFTWGVIDSCTGRSGNDDISNIMDYAYDSCRDHFTEGQIMRMHEQMMRFKPNLYAYTKGSDTSQCKARPDGIAPPETEGPEKPTSKSPTENPTKAPTKRPTKTPTRSPTPPKGTIPPSTKGGSPAPCVTTGGWTTAGTSCVFPFTFAGGVFNECAPVEVHKPFWGTNKPPPAPPSGGDDTFWCATTAAYSKYSTSLRKSWGYCSFSCPKPDFGDDGGGSSTPIDDPVDDPVDEIPVDDPVDTDLPTTSATRSPTYSKTCKQFNSYGFQSRNRWCTQRPDCKMVVKTCVSRSKSAATPNPTSKPSPSPTAASTSCLVKAGGYAKAGSKCIFPFTYQAKNGKKTVYNECPTVGQSGPWGKNNKKLKGSDLWCSTVKTYKVKYRSKRWGICGDQPVCGKPLATLPPLGCTTDGGWLPKGTPCKFPFTYMGKVHNGCASVAKHRPFWGTRNTFGTPKNPTSPSATKEYWCSKIGQYSATVASKQKKWGFCDCGGSLTPDAFQSLASKGTWEIDETQAPTPANQTDGDGGGGGGGNAAPMIVGLAVGCLALAGVVAFFAHRRNAKRAYDDLEADTEKGLGARPSKRRVSVTRNEGPPQADVVPSALPKYITRLKRFMTPDRATFTSVDGASMVVEKEKGSAKVSQPQASADGAMTVVEEERGSDNVSKPQASIRGLQIKTDEERPSSESQLSPQ